MSHRQPRRCAQKTAPPALEHLEDRYLLSADGFAPIDGVGNNIDNPELGSTNEQLIRIGDAAYDDGLNDPARSDGVNAREISDLLSAQDESVENDHFITSVWFLWGQFLDHDITRVFDSPPRPRRWISPNSFPLIDLRMIPKPESIRHENRSTMLPRLLMAVSCTDPTTHALWRCERCKAGC